MIEHNWEQRKEIIISILEDTITLLEDMSHSFQKDYHPKRISPFRHLCFGYLLITKNNIITSLLLIKNNMMYQIHYISRNMYEMVINLSYINTDKTKLEERVQRFFDFRICQKYNCLDTMNKYPEIHQGFRTLEKDYMIQDEYNKYLSKYYKNDKKRVILYWSGISLYQMINSILDDKKRDNLLRGYYWVDKINNQYIHPSYEYIKNVIDDEYVSSVKSDDRYKNELYLLEVIYISVFMIIEIYLEHFQKNRLLFRKRHNQLEMRFEEYLNLFQNKL